jgi:hypothetical protein
MRIALICLSLFLGTNAYAQNANDFINIFGGLVQMGIRQAAQSQWQRLSDNEVACIDQQLENRGMSVDAMIERGVAPGDPRLAQARSYCRNNRGNQTSQDSQTSGQSSSAYIVDGLALGDKVVFNSAAYNRYQCSPSEKFPGFTWCHKDETKKDRKTDITFSNSILHAKDGTAWYINRYIEQATFEKNEVWSEINRLSAKFGQSPAREIQMPHKDGLPDATMAVWGKVELEQLSDGEVTSVANGGRHEGVLVAFLGDLERSARAGTPLYRLGGGAGYVWVATYNSAGRGVLRFLAIDDSKTNPQDADNNEPAPPKPDVPPAPAPRNHPPPPTYEPYELPSCKDPEVATVLKKQVSVGLFRHMELSRLMLK